MKTVYSGDKSTPARSGIVAMYVSLHSTIGVGYSVFVSNQKGLRVKSKLHTFWDLLEPIVVSLIFVLLFEFRALPIPVGQLPYAVFVVTGVLLWQSLCDSIMLILEVIPRFSSILSHTKLAPEALMWSTIFQVGYSSTLRFVAVCLLLGSFGMLELAYVLAGCLTWLVACLSLFSVGLLLAPFNALLPDIGRFVSIVLRPMLYVSGVIFPLPSHGSFQSVATLNPFFVYVDAFRTSITSGQLSWGSEMINFCILFFIIFHLGWFVFHKTILVVAERA